MNSVRVPVFRDYFLELIISVVATGLGLLSWLSAKIVEFGEKFSGKSWFASSWRDRVCFCDEIYSEV
jgi:hypothetical protein